MYYSKWIQRKRQRYYDNNRRSSYEYYPNFIQSDRWKEFRNKLIRERGNKCELCGENQDLNVHHKDLKSYNYTNLSNDYNFRVLCKDCHSLIHQLHKAKPPIINQIVIEQLKLSFLNLPDSYKLVLSDSYRYVF